ncbi:MAG: hypothetical protein K2J12_10875 [Muribaculaceae bacterium]|nr:hypothetical protein [Muribaculaceae bacterium]
MTKEQQDLAWVCLPKEVRDHIRVSYKGIYCVTGISIQIFLDWVFGCHNLTSDTEPSELLYVERTKVQEYKKEVEDALAENCDSVYSIPYWRGQQTALDRLFGDKCLPDTEEQNSPKHSNSCQIGKNPLEPYTEENETKRKETQSLSLSDEELNNIIFDLIRIRENRRENEHQLMESIAKLKNGYFAD